jgi:hypothetical protein
MNAEQSFVKYITLLFTYQNYSMRKAYLLLFIASILLTGACKKTTENVVDCIAESLFVSVKYKADAVNSRTINFEGNYSVQTQFNQLSGYMVMATLLKLTAPYLPILIAMPGPIPLRQKYPLEMETQAVHLNKRRISRSTKPVLYFLRERQFTSIDNYQRWS